MKEFCINLYHQVEVVDILYHIIFDLGKQQHKQTKLVSMNHDESAIIVI
jgi:hypothetical protein